MKIKKGLLIAALVLVNLLYSLGLVANAAEVSASTTNIVLKGDDKDFTLDLSVNNNGKPYSGAEFGIRLNGVEITGIKYKVSDFGQAGPVTRDGVTYFGFFNTSNVYSDGQVCTLSLRYSGNDNVKMIMEETQVTTRVDKNNISSDKKYPKTEILVKKEQPNSNSNSNGKSDGKSGDNSKNNSNGNSGNGNSSSINSNNNSNGNANSGSNTNSSDNNGGNGSTSNNKETATFAPTDKIPTEDILKLLQKKESNVIVNLTKADILSKDILTAIQGKDINITFNLLDEKSQMIISWTFNGLNISGDIEDIDLSASFKAPEEIQKGINSLIKNKTSAIISFAYNGVLPGKAQIKAFVGDKFVSGDELNLYYYNEATHKAELVANKLKVDNNGYVVFNIEHCSTYFLTKETIKGAVNNTSKGSAVNKPDNNIIIWQVTSGVLAVMLIAFSGIIVWQHKKIESYKMKDC